MAQLELAFVKSLVLPALCYRLYSRKDQLMTYIYLAGESTYL